MTTTITSVETLPGERVRVTFSDMVGALPSNVSAITMTHGGDTYTAQSVGGGEDTWLLQFETGGGVSFGPGDTLDIAAGHGGTFVSFAGGSKVI